MSSYGPDVRWRWCRQCGESMSAEMVGGTVICPSCSTAHELVPRALQPLAGDRAEETPEEAQRRVGMLRKQAQTYNRDNKYTFVTAPEGMESLGKLLGDEAVEQMTPAFHQAVARCEQAGINPQRERRVYWLAAKLRAVFALKHDDVTGRALLHTALDALEDSGYQHSLRCRLARLAGHVGDLEGAGAWLALCDPAQTILDLDSDYRVARATVAGARGVWSETLALVGEDEWAVPHEPSSVALLGSLRVAALEHLGRGFEAEEALKTTIKITPAGEQFFRDMYADSEVFAACMVVWARYDPVAATGSELTATAAQEEAGVFTPPSLGWLGVAIALAVVALVLLVVGYGYQQQHAREAKWKPTKATLVKVSSRSTGRGKSAQIQVYVSYTYKVGKTSYEGDRFESDKQYFSYKSDRSASRKISELKGRKTFTVYYDPAKPSLAVIERMGTAICVMLYSIGGVLCVVVLLLLFAYLKRRKRYGEKVRAAMASEE